MTTRTITTSIPTTRPAAGVAVAIPSQPTGALSCWRRLIRRVDPAKTGAYALDGPRLEPAVAYEIPQGAVVMVVDHHPGHWQVRMTTAQPEGLIDVHAWTLKSPLGKRVVDYVARRLPTTAPDHDAARLEAMPNRWPGRCRLCRGPVDAGAGIVTLHSRRVEHRPGECPPPPQVITPNRWSGTCGACGGWVNAGKGVAIRLTSPRPITGGHYEPMHQPPCPPDAPPGPPNRQPGWCADCRELVAAHGGYWLSDRLHHHGPCPAPTVTAPTWICRTEPYTPIKAGQPAWVRLVLSEQDPDPAAAPGYRVLDSGYAELVGVPLETVPGRLGRTRARVRAATTDEAADLLAARMASADLARPHAAGHRARFTAEQIGDTRPWLAEITGREPRFGLRRRFLRADRDFSAANSRGTRGVVYGWTLAANRVYEAFSPITWSRAERSFLRAAPDGDVAVITREEVEAWLDNAAVWIAS